MSKLSDRKIKNEPANPLRETRLSDGAGLFVSISKVGSKSFVYRYVYAGKRQLMVLGAYPALTLQQAREERLKQERLLQEGKNPLQIKQRAKVDLLDAKDVNALIDDFHKRYLKVRYEQPDEAFNTLKRDVAPVIGRMLARDVTKLEVTRIINRIKERGSPVAANRTLTLLRSMFGHAVDQNMIDTNPVTLTRKGAGGPEKAKTTHLSLKEIKRLLGVLDSPGHGVSWQTRAVLKLILATGKRVGEVVSAEWSHMDLIEAVWTNPKHLTKEKREDHIVFLSGYSVALLEEVRRVSGRSKFVFPSPHEDLNHLDPHTVSKAVLRLLKDGTLQMKFTPHDLRRTVSSRMADLGVPPHVVEKILDHLMEGVMAVYNRASYFPERKEAMETWGKELALLSQQ